MLSVAITLGESGARDQYKPVPVSPRLRGYTETDSQVRLATTSGKMVAITAVSARFCPTGRDLFLEKVLKLNTPNWDRTVMGKVIDLALVKLHELGMNHMEDAFEEAVQNRKAVDLDELRRRIVASGEEHARSAVANWSYDGSDATLKDIDVDAFAERMAGSREGGSELIERTIHALVELVHHETDILISYLRRKRGWSWLTRSSAWMSDARATLLRLQTGFKLDPNENHARQFGFMPGINPDFVYAVTLLGDLKSGHYHQFYESVATGYAIYAESVFRRRINGAAILSVEFDLNAEKKLRKHHVHLVCPDDSARHLWVTHRDFALQIVRAETAPSHPTDTTKCQDCPYRSHCWRDGRPGENPVTPDPPTRRSAAQQGRAGGATASKA